MKQTLGFVLASIAAVAMSFTPFAAFAGGPVNYRGQGATPDGFGSYDLTTELCGVQNGADADGPYLLWVLTSTGASSANITGPWGANVPMTRSGNGTYKYVSGYYHPGEMIGAVSGTYAGTSKNVQLVISHGCRPFTRGAWCSPGFWRNSSDAAWTKTGHARTELFNTTVYNVWYGATYAANPTLDTVLTTSGSTYKGAGVAGTSGVQMNAFNAVGAMLSNSIPGYTFSESDMLAGDDSSCPLDNGGNWK